MQINSRGSTVKNLGIAFIDPVESSESIYNISYDKPNIPVLRPALFVFTCSLLTSNSFFNSLVKFSSIDNGWSVFDYSTFSSSTVLVLGLYEMYLGRYA